MRKGKEGEEGKGGIGREWTCLTDNGFLGLGLGPGGDSGDKRYWGNRVPFHPSGKWNDPFPNLNFGK